MNDPIIPWWRTDLGRNEISQIEKSILNRHISQGPVTEELEIRLARFLDVPYALLTTNGSVALVMALIACGVGPGDEVIIPGLTFIATAQAPLLLGAKVNLVDVEKNRPIIDVAEIESAISDETKAIIPVHLNGLSADIKGIRELAKRYDLLVIEDAAQALGSKNPDGYLGTQSHIGCYSLGITKLITTGQGGLVVTESEETYQRLRRIRNHGLPSPSERRFETIGCNFKQTDILASLGLAQFSRIQHNIHALRKIYRFYKTELSDMDYLKMIEVDERSGELPLWAEVLCAERDRVINLLWERRIQAKPFDSALCEFSYLKSRGVCKNSALFSRYGLILPSGPDQPMEDLRKTVEVLREISPHVERELGSVEACW